MAVPMWLLYEIGVLFARMLNRKPEGAAGSDGPGSAA
jgi:Sec-independent protein secretion pathway component TatC